MTIVIACVTIRIIGKNASNKADINHPLRKENNSPDIHMATES